jgi:hypothetical protein
MMWSLNGISGCNLVGNLGFALMKVIENGREFKRIEGTLETLGRNFVDFDEARKKLIAEV